MTPNGKAIDGMYRRVCFSVFSYLMLQMKNENRYSWSYFYIPFSVFELGKGKKKLDYPILFFPLWNRRMKNKRTVYTTRGCFPFILFSSCNWKNENGYKGSYFYFSFFVWGLEKRKRMLIHPFSIFYHEREKRKTKGRYIHGPTSRHTIYYHRCDCIAGGGKRAMHL